MEPIAEDGSTASDIYHKDRGNLRYALASNTEKLMIGVDINGSAWARNMTRGMHQDKKGDTDAKWHQNVDMKHKAHRPTEWTSRVEINGVDARRLPAVGPLPSITRICINECVWLWISRTGPVRGDLSYRDIPPTVPEHVSIQRVDSLRQELATDLSEDDEYGRKALEEIGRFVQDYFFGASFDNRDIDVLCRHITQLRQEQREALQNEHDGNQMTMDPYAYTATLGIRAPPSHRKPPRPSWQRLLGGADNGGIKTHSHPETQSGYIGPIDWVGGQDIILNANIVLDRVPSPTGTGETIPQISNMTDLSELERLQERVRAESDLPRPGDVHTEPDVSSGSHLQSHFSYMPHPEPMPNLSARKDSRSVKDQPQAENMDMLTTWKLIYHKLSNRPETDCVFFSFGTGVFFDRCFSGFSPHTTVRDWTAAESVDYIKLPLVDFVDLCARKRYWIFPIHSTQPLGENYPDRTNTALNLHLYISSPDAPDNTSKIRIDIPQVDKRVKGEIPRWSYDEFMKILQQRMSIGLADTKGGANARKTGVDRAGLRAADEWGYTVSWDQLLGPEDQKSPNTIKTGFRKTPPWNWLSDQEDFDKLICYAGCAADVHQELHIELRRRKPENLPVADDFETWCTSPVTRGDAGHWVMAIFDTTNGETYAHDSLNPNSNPRRLEGWFFNGLRAFVNKYDWQSIKTAKGINTPDPVPPIHEALVYRGVTGGVLPNGPTFGIDTIRGTTQQASGWECGWMTLTNALHFFLDYAARDGLANGVTSKGTSPAAEPITDVLLGAHGIRNYWQMNISYWMLRTGQIVMDLPEGGAQSKMAEVDKLCNYPMWLKLTWS